MPALWYSSVAVLTCPTATKPPSVNSTTPLAATRYVSKNSSKQPSRLGTHCSLFLPYTFRSMMFSVRRPVRWKTPLISWCQWTPPGWSCGTSPHPPNSVSVSSLKAANSWDMPTLAIRTPFHMLSSESTLNLVCHTTRSASVQRPLCKLLNLMHMIRILFTT